MSEKRECVNCLQETNLEFICPTCRENDKKVKNLSRVIKSLEYLQQQHYSPDTNLALSYLIDIRDNRVPEKLVTDN